MYFAVGLNIVSMLGMVAGVLMHSGRGGGLSDMFGGGVSSSMSSSGVAERNLNRFTIAVALIWSVVILLLGVLQRFVG